MELFQNKNVYSGTKNAFQPPHIIELNPYFSIVLANTGTSLTSLETLYIYMYIYLFINNP